MRDVRPRCAREGHACPDSPAVPASRAVDLVQRETIDQLAGEDRFVHLLSVEDHVTRSPDSPLVVHRTGQHTPPDGPRTSSSIRPNDRVRRGERGGWASRVGFRLQDRDVRILFAISAFRLATRQQLQTLFFGSADTARDRITKLREAGLVRTFARGLNDDLLHALTPRGRDVLCEHREIDPEDIVVARSVPAHARHFISTNDVRAAVAAAIRKRSELALLFFRPAWELATAEVAKRVEVVPDALVGIEHAAGEIVIAVEVDRNTEAPSFVARRKLAIYDTLIASGTGVFGYVPSRVVVLAPGVRRLRHLAAAIVDARAGREAYLGDLDDHDARGLLAARFARPVDLADLRGDVLACALNRPLHSALSSPVELPCPRGDRERANQLPPQGIPSARKYRIRPSGQSPSA